MRFEKAWMTHKFSFFCVACVQSRPFGVALLIAGWDENGPVLYHTDPSGMYSKFSAKAMGSGAEGAQTALQESFRADLTLREAEVLALSTLKQVMEEKVSSHTQHHLGLWLQPSGLQHAGLLL